MQFSKVYAENVKLLDDILSPDKSFDLIKRRLVVGEHEATFYYIDGMVKDDTMLKLMQIFTGLKGLPTGADAAARFADKSAVTEMMYQPKPIVMKEKEEK